MSPTALRDRHCVPCEGGVPPLDDSAIRTLLAETPAWEWRGMRLRRTALFPDFVALMRFVNAMADAAEAEGHHPDFHVHWNKLDIELWTHAAGGLTENDFVLAARLDALLAADPQAAT